ncbi:hypothetical protein K469DRAFT_788750 [Zopfia rhizophila CBS 207.26]|uniref:HECT-type E3 ubiquitin transferase n=1 Tax=Zopfia rhizophila CBS 207.26 TaxID=1314779 RepID=A0A6A6EQT0_9PEZI|nr:hypothetical protein K469DRAFT_788750 [Zopfia rhizophila CBS 207.26]
MTGPSRGASDPRSEPRSVSSTSSDGERRSRTRRTEGREDILNTVIDVEDPDKLMECSQIQRQLRFQYIVRRYISQILHGCRNQYCTTPTCLSCKKRITSKPCRAPTQLTARALAHFLASQDDPYADLCPHELNVSPSTLEISGATGVEIKEDKGGVGRICNVYPPVKACEQSPGELLKSQYSDSTAESSGTKLDKQGNNHNDDVNKVFASLNERHQTKKDVKSLGQNLFDTVTVIYSYSKQIPSPLSVFNSLRLLRIPGQKLLGTDRNHESDEHLVNEPDADASSSEGMTTAPNGHAEPPHMNGVHPTPTQPDLHHSQRNQRTAQKSNSTRIVSEVLSNGQRVHKIRHPLPEPVVNGHSSLKTNDPASFDGTEDSHHFQTSTMKTKPHLLDTRQAAKTDPSVFSPSATRRDAYIRRVDEGKGFMLPVTSHLNCEILDRLKEQVYHRRDEQSSDFTFVVDYEINTGFRPTKPFVNRSMFYTLSDPVTLLKSFRETDSDAYKDSPLPHLNSTRLTHAFRDWNRRNGALIFDSLWVAAKALFTPPPELDVQKSPRLKAARKFASTNGPAQPPPTFTNDDDMSGRYLSDEEAAHIVMICIHALTSLIPVGWPHTWIQIRKLRSWGVILPDAPAHDDLPNGFAHPWLNIIDELEYEPALRLADRLVRGIAARICFQEILITLSGQKTAFGTQPHGLDLMGILMKHLGKVEEIALMRRKKLKASLNYDDDPGWTVAATFMEWLRTIIIKKWDGKAEINRWTSVGAAIQILDGFYRNRESLNLRTGMFYMPFLHERLDPVQTPTEFLARFKAPNSLHLLNYPFLFLPQYLITYFRTINYASMHTQYDLAERATHLQRQLDPFLREPYWWLIKSRLKVTLSDYLVLDVRRDCPLEDALDQLWGLERRQLLKPLKVKMGAHEGEAGLDHGGISIEFSRVILTEAFDPDKGMFTIDPQSRMTWFQPASLEPLYKYEMLGVLFSLAVYNGITLPVTFPLALYRFLLGGLATQLDHIRDGWPALAKSLEQLLSWNDGDVGDVFVRSYSFSFEGFGRNVDVDMQAFGEYSLWPADYEGKLARNQCTSWPRHRRPPNIDSPGWQRPRPGPESECAIDHSTRVADETPLVTNANREDFVKDYIFWLVYRSVAPQLRAFRDGFMTCLHPGSLDLFNEISLQALVEGDQDIDIPTLRRATHYEEGYSATHRTIIDFWDIVEKYSSKEKKLLLEFVTASDRVPATGISNMMFCVVRNGGDSELLPTASTCFGKLMLPEYANKGKMKTKLDLAIQNSKGFGVV